MTILSTIAPVSIPATQLADAPTVDAINQVLPQTQCTRCTYSDCLSYARAIATEAAPINQCPPGGDEGIAKLAALTKKEVVPLNTAFGSIKAKTIVYIAEEDCIGCTLCIKACPVDAIIGSNKLMHTVIANECTGCDLCVKVCPVDCIHIIDDENPTWSNERQEVAKIRYEQRNSRRKNAQIAQENRLKQINHNKLLADLLQ